MRRARRPVALGGLVLLAVALLGAVGSGLVRTTIDTQASSFLPADDPAARTTADAASAFGGDPIVVLLESEQPHGLTTGDQLSALLRLEGRLAGLPDTAATYGPATVLNQIAGRTQDLLGELVGRRDGLRIAAQRTAVEAGAGPAAVEEAGRAATAGFDARYGPLLVQGMPAGLPTTKNQKFVDQVLYGPGGDPNPQWRFVLPDRSSAAVLVRPRQDLDQAGAERLVEGVRQAVAESGTAATRSTVSGVPVVAAEMAGHVRHELPLLGGIAAVAVGAWFWFVRWTERRHRLVPLLSTVAATALTLAGFGLAGRPLSLGVIAFLPILLGVGSDFMTYLARGAERRTVVAVALAAAASFGSLALVVPVRAIGDLGLALGIGMVVAVGTSLLVSARLRRGGPPEPLPAPLARRPLGRRARVGIGAAMLAVTVVGWAVLPNLALRTDVEDFASGTPALADARHIEDVLGSSAEIGVLVSGKDALSPAAVGWMSRAQDVIVTRFGDRLRPAVSPTSILGFLGDSPSAAEIDSAVRLLPPYLSGAVVTGDRSRAMMSFGTRFDSAEGMSRLRDGVRAALPPPPPGVDVELTGLPLVAAGGYDAISADRYAANAAGILAAGAVLLLLLRRRRDAVVAVAASVVATGAGLAGLWLAGIALSPVTVGLGSLTAAVACEFAVVLAVADRLRDTGLRRSVALAASASATGYGVLVLSDLSVIAEFGVLLSVSVGLAYVAAVLAVRIAAPAPTDPDDPHPVHSTSPDLVGANS